MKTILLVADDADLRATMCTTLQNAHYDITQAPSAPRAIEIAQQEPPDLIVCDMSMPHGAGLDLLTTLGHNPDTENIPVLLITGEKAQPLSPFAGTVATDLLCKPFSDSDLVAAVNTRLRTRATFDDARRRNNQRLLTVVESTSALVALIDPQDYRLSYLNKTGCNMLELEPPATAVGAHFMSFFPEGEDRTAIEIGLSQAAVQGHWIRQVTLLGRQGRRTDVELYLQAHRAPNGELDYYELTARDITRQKATEAQLNLLSRAIEQVPTSIIITDATGCIKYVNPRFSRITGYSATEVIGLNPRILKSGNTPPEVYTALWKAITHGREWRGTLQNRRKNGELFWEQATISSVIDEHGRTSHYISFKEDITDQHTAEESLRKEQQLVQILMSTIPSRIYFKDLKSRFIRVNEAHAKHFGQASPDDLVGKTDFDFFTQEHAQAAYEDEQRIIQTGTPILNLVEKETWPDRPPTWVATTKMPLRDEHETIVGTFGLSTDITEQKRNEEQRAALELQLHQAQKLESIGRLAAGIAHEINTPTQYVSDNIHFIRKALGDLEHVLAAYTGLVQWIRAQGPIATDLALLLAPAEKVRLDYLRREIPVAISDAEEGLTRVTKIVRAMKNFSHPGQDTFTPVDLNQAIESTLTVSRNEWKYVAELVTDFDPQLPLIPCLPGEFNQVILNIVVNAAHAIADVVGFNTGKKGTISVSTRLDGNWVEIRIRDTGTGIPLHAQPHVFEQFYTTKQIGKGTGQGLALARAVIVDQHAGTLTFETQPGTGTTFIIRLPLQQNAPAKQGAPQ